jgi:hypothetical protein
MISVEHRYNLSSVLIDACETLVSAIECLPVSLSLCLNVGQSFFLFRSVYAFLSEWRPVSLSPSVFACLFNCAPVSLCVYLSV